MRDSKLPPRFLVINSSACMHLVFQHKKGALQVSFGVSTTLFSMHNVLLVACHGLLLHQKHSHNAASFWKTITMRAFLLFAVMLSSLSLTGGQILEDPGGLTGEEPDMPNVVNRFCDERCYASGGCKGRPSATHCFLC
jgi:hypothetical protein